MPRQTQWLRIALQIHWNIRYGVHIPNHFYGHQFYEEQTQRLVPACENRLPPEKKSMVDPSFSHISPYVPLQKSPQKNGPWVYPTTGTQLGFLLGPSVIDSSFQALMALAEADVGIGSLKIPLSIKRPGGRARRIPEVWLMIGGDSTWVGTTNDRENCFKQRGSFGIVVIFMLHVWILCLFFWRGKWWMNYDLPADLHASQDLQTRVMFVVSKICCQHGFGSSSSISSSCWSIHSGWSFLIWNQSPLEVFAHYFFSSTVGYVTHVNLSRIDQDRQFVEL